jgi:hypothetical protein
MAYPMNRSKTDRAITITMALVSMTAIVFLIFLIGYNSGFESGYDSGGKYNCQNAKDCK